VTVAPDHRDTEHSSGDELRLSVADHRLGKTRVLARQCSTCVFAPGNRMHLAPGQLSDMVKQARRTGSCIICHDTLPYGPYPHIPPATCRGFYDRYDTQALQVARRLWGFVEVDPPQPEPPSDQGTDPGPPGAAPHPQEEMT
jgi:hypothetical protein